MKILQICPPHLSDVATKKSFSVVIFIYTSDYFRYLRRKQTVIHLTTPPENDTTLTCKMQNFSIWLEVCCVLSNVSGSGKSRLWVGISGSEKNRLWSVTTGMPAKQRHSKGWKWLSFAWIHASHSFRHWSYSYSSDITVANIYQSNPQMVTKTSWHRYWKQLGYFRAKYIRYDTRCYFNVRSKVDISQLNLPHGTDK